MNLRQKAIIYAIVIIIAALACPAFAQEGTKLLRQPDISKTQIVFVYGGDLWAAPRSGGDAHRLTANPSIKMFPKFSPDGKYIAFTGNYDGNNDVYVIPAEGGDPKRLTYHPGMDAVLGWTPDSKAVLLRSDRTSPFTMKLYTVPLTGGSETELPVPEAGLASFSPDGNKVAYNRLMREFATWKRYRGGWQSYISIFDLKNNTYSELPHTDTTDFFPMWHGDKIYFASDRSGTANLFWYDLKTRATRQLTHYDDYDVKWPSLGADAIVFEHGGALTILDLNTEKTSSVTIWARSELLGARPGIRRVEENIRSFGISPSGARAVFEARGDIFTVPAKKGDVRDITNTPGIREINAAWSPDGKSIAYLSDRTGEFELYVRPQDGSGDETRLTTDGSVYRYGPVWSPDSKSLLYSDANMRMWMISVADKKPILLDTDTNYQIALGKWSPDSKWIAYGKVNPALPNGNGQSYRIWLYSVDQRNAFPIGEGKYNDREPVFDRNGKYLYFLSDRNFTPNLNFLDLSVNFKNLTGLFAVLLQGDAVSPFVPESDEEKPKEESPKKEPEKPGAAPPDVKIDLDGIDRRIISLPVPPGEYTRLEAGAGKVFFLAASSTLHRFETASRKDETVTGGITDYQINPDGSKLLYRTGPYDFGIADANPGVSTAAGKLNLVLEMKVDPPAEWRQMFKEAWRMERDFFYDPNMHGLDWKAIGDRYGKLVTYVAHRADLTYLLGELLGELNTSHAYVAGAENPPVKQINVGLLGVDFEPNGGYYRFKKIYPGLNWNSDARSPLAEQGLKVKEGDYVIAVNRVPLKTDTNPYAPFQGLAGKTVTVKINDRPAEEGSREIRVRPIASERRLRYLDWVENNRKRVEMATGGRVGYVHVPDTGESGIQSFGTGYYSQVDKDALIIDERNNGGGFVPTFFIEKLSRQLMGMASQRYGMDSRWPDANTYGPKVILANERSGSGGDAFPYMFRKAGLGPIIGKRTWGGLVGYDSPRILMDGGSITTPEVGFWSPEKQQWIAENRGVEPDIEVDNRADLVVQGHDPQLERAIAYIMEQLKKYPTPKYQHPPFPMEKKR